MPGVGITFSQHSVLIFITVSLPFFMQSFARLWQHLGCTVEESEELQEMVCEACMNKAHFLWTYAAHFAGNSPHKQQRQTCASVLDYALPQQNSKCNYSHICLFHSAQPVIKVSHSQKDEEVNVEEGEKGGYCDAIKNGCGESSLSLESMKQEKVRNGTDQTSCTAL